MKILVLTSSPRVKGTSNTLTEEFIKGAQDAGHEIEKIDLAKAHINPCLGCNYCGMDGDCIQQDEMQSIIAKMLEVDALCLATPVYYFGVSSQLKKFIDRFYSRTIKITEKNLKVVFITTAWGDEEAMRPLKIYIEKLFDYMRFINCGMLFGTGCGEVSMIPAKFYEEAYELGKNLR